MQLQVSLHHILEDIYWDVGDISVLWLWKPMECGEVAEEYTNVQHSVLGYLGYILGTTADPSVQQGDRF